MNVALFIQLHLALGLLVVQADAVITSTPSSVEAGEYIWVLVQVPKDYSKSFRLRFFRVIDKKPVSIQHESPDITDKGEHDRDNRTGSVKYMIRTDADWVKPNITSEDPSAGNLKISLSDNGSPIARFQIVLLRFGEASKPREQAAETDDGKPRLVDIVAKSSDIPVVYSDPNAREGIRIAYDYARQGDWGRASGSLARVLERHEDFGEGHLEIARMYRNQQQWEPAMRAYGRAAEHLDGKKQALPYYWYGKILIEQENNVSSAIPLLQYAVRADSENPIYLGAYGHALVDAKRYDGAIMAFSQLLEMEDRDVPEQPAMLHWSADHGATVPAFKKALELPQSRGSTHLVLAWTNLVQIERGCPCGPKDEGRVAQAHMHYERAFGLGLHDAQLSKQVEALSRGAKVK